MKKVILCLLTVSALLFGCLALSSCTTTTPPSGSNENTQIMAIYDNYVLNAEEKGETPLSYEDWLAQIKGDKGDQGEKGEDGKSAYEIWLDNGNQGTEADFLNWLKGDNDSSFVINVEIVESGALKVTFSDGKIQFIPLPQGGGVQSSSKLQFQRIAGKNEYRVIGIGMESELDIVIPSTYNTLPVTEIGANAFKDALYITSVIIPDSVTSIGSNAFRNCSSLISITIPDSVTSIGDSAFNVCTSLTSVEIGDSVTSIGSSAFAVCNSLTSVVIGDSVTSIGNYAFQSCSSLTSVIIGGSVTSIGDWAFDYCSSLISVEISDLANWCQIDGLHNIVSSNRTLYLNGEELSSEIVIPNTVTEIKPYAFRYCDKITSITIPDSVTSIGYDAFYGCNSLTSIEISNLANWCQIDGLDEIVSSNRTLYLNGEELSGEIVIPNTVTEIKPCAFYYCDKITSVIIPDSVTSIGSYAFYSCSSLISVVIGDSVTSIGDCAFYECSRLTSVEIPDSVTSIGDYAFYGCGSLTSIYYKGTAEEWAEISIDDQNYDLTYTTKYYYIENEEDVPTDGGNYWHYDENGEIAVW